MAEVDHDPVSAARKKYGRCTLSLLGTAGTFNLSSHSLHPADAITVDEKTGLKNYPFQLKPVPRLPWEDPHADHLMTQEVCEPVHRYALTTTDRFGSVNLF